MTEGWPILSLLIFLPLAGAALIFSIQGKAEIVDRNARALALWTSSAAFLLALIIALNFDPRGEAFQFMEHRQWLSGVIAYRLGIDGISLPLILLTTLLTPLCILASWSSITKRVQSFMAAFLVMETLMLGVFCALDLVLFYIFFEGGLIPMFLIIGIWGGAERLYASFKFFLYTLLGSLLMLLAILAIYWSAGTTSIPALLESDLPPDLQRWLWLAFLASFAVKLPMWPVHSWLPDAHVQAPTAGSVILAGILLKMGGYGFLRFSLPIFPSASVEFAPLIFALSVIAILYASLIALVQEDIKKLIAYASIAHMGYVTIGMFSMTMEGLQGGIFQMLSHGFVSAALFLSVGVLYDRMHSRDISAFGGAARIMPLFALAFMIFTLANVGLPGTSGFIGEFLSVVGVFSVSMTVAALAALGVILSVAYSLRLYRRIFYEDPASEDAAQMPDLSWRESFVFAPLIAATLLFGIYPKPIFTMTDPAIARIAERMKTAKAKLHKDERAAIPSRRGFQESGR